MCMCVCTVHVQVHVQVLVQVQGDVLPFSLYLRVYFLMGSFIVHVQLKVFFLVHVTVQVYVH